MKNVLLVKGKYVITMDDNFRIIENGAVVIKRDKIVALDSFKNINSRFKGSKVINIDNGIVLPGLINTHTHIAMAYFRGLADDLPLDEWLQNHIWPAETKYINPSFVRTSSELACLEMIKAGTTCFNDMYFFEEETAKIAIKCGIRAVVGEGILNFPTPSCKFPKETFAKTKNLLNNFKKNELINISVAPHSVYTCDKKILLQAKKIADKNNLILHIHISETKKEFKDIQKKCKMSPVQYLEKIGFLGKNVVAAHSVWLDSSDLKIYEKRGVKISHNPVSNMKLASGVAPIFEATTKFNLDVGLGTDGPASNNTLDLFSEMKTTALLHKVNKHNPSVLHARDIVRMATIGGANVLGLNKKIGSLEIGKYADIITIDLDKPHLQPIYDPYSHLVYCANGSDVKDAIINGRIIMRNRKVLTIDEKKVLRKTKQFILNK